MVCCHACAVRCPFYVTVRPAPFSQIFGLRASPRSPSFRANCRRVHDVRNARASLYLVLMGICASKKASSAIAEPVYGKKEPAVGTSADDTAPTAEVVEGPNSPQKTGAPPPSAAASEEENPLQSTLQHTPHGPQRWLRCCMQCLADSTNVYLSRFCPVATKAVSTFVGGVIDSARGLLAAAAPSSEPVASSSEELAAKLEAEQAAPAPATSFATSSTEAAAEATESTAAAPSSAAAPAPAAAVQIV